MRSNLPQTQLVTHPKDFTQINFCKTDILKYLPFILDDVALIQTCRPEGNDCKAQDINVFIGAFTTTHARLELYDLMDNNTDYVIFVFRDGDWIPPLGHHLGKLMDEIGDKNFIVEYASSGPKSYGYQTAKG